MREVASSRLVGRRKRGCGELGPEGGAELRAGWRGSCEGGFFPEVRLRADSADRIGDFTQLFVMRA